MRPQFQFTMRRAMFAATLIAMGLACWPLANTLSALRIQRNLDAFRGPALVLCLVLCWALPAAGVGSLCSRTLRGLYVGLEIGLWVGLFFCLYMLVPRVD
jgi:hypothetical protein